MHKNSLTDDFGSSTDLLVRSAIQGIVADVHLVDLKTKGDTLKYLESIESNGR
jgi:hypothetical protein